MNYRLKLTITIALLIAVSFGIGGTLMITTSFHESLKQETQTALDAFESLQNTLYLLSALGERTDFENLSNALAQMEDQGMAQWQALVLRNGADLLFRSGGEALLDYDLPIPASDQCTYLHVSDAGGRGLVVLGRMAAGADTLQLLARFDLSAVYDIREAQQKQYVAIYFAVVGFGILAATALSFALTRHLRLLTETAKQIGGGDLSRRSRIRSRDEFGVLSRNFDEMADKLQENIRRLEEEMSRQERFMGAFAHELKTPMTSIIGFADLLRQDGLDETTRITAAEYIHSEGRRLERLSFKLLELLLLQKDGLAMKQVPLERFVADIERAMAPVLEARGITLVCRADRGRAAMEPDLVKSLLYNLIDNAAKAMDHGGTIRLSAEAIPGGCRIRVADNGRGMAAEELERITEAFYRVDKARSRSQGGAGLGLSLCKQIARLHGGTIGFESEPGRGTLVTVTLCAEAGEPDE